MFTLLALGFMAILYEENLLIKFGDKWTKVENLIVVLGIERKLKCSDFDSLTPTYEGHFRNFRPFCRDEIKENVLYPIFYFLFPSLITIVILEGVLMYVAINLLNYSKEKNSYSYNIQTVKFQENPSIEQYQ